GDTDRRQILIPDSAHGTNPASTSMAGFTVLQVPSDQRGNIDLEAVRAACDPSIAGIMLTNPNTLGLFEEHIEEVTGLVHACGGLVYGDGANMNALTGVLRPADVGVDVMHYNLHKTFATPHGGGGPGSGPIAATGALADFLPGPVVTVDSTSDSDAPRRYRLADPPRSIGRVCTFHGNFGMLVRAYAYIRLHGAEGLRQNARHAVLNANYLRVKLRRTYPVPYDRMTMHEFVCQGLIHGSPVRALDIAKRLIDHGFHPPTNYFPLIVPEALMIEPTETESRETLDAFVDAMEQIAVEAVEDPELLLSAPHTTPVGRLDEVRAARHLVLRQLPAEPGA
ncbi:MAG: aminomethyl-transferring glycine dehydrogenase subunit GcvPB, partial [Acidimicrobiia bacterium]|nr:aminomethyl-transferring glycine dehydrogenase subunit GcvPB [Acidimicrobiia bacterium]